MIKRKIPKRPDWDEFFMMHTYLAATRSSCFHLNTGATIVKDKRIIAMGYNGAPSGIKNSFDQLTIDDFKIENYNPHPAIKRSMSV